MVSPCVVVVDGFCEKKKYKGSCSMRGARAQADFRRELYSLENV